MKDDNFQVDDNKPNPEDWAEFMEHDPDFMEEFNRVIDNEEIPEADEELLPEVLDDTYMNMEVTVPRQDDGPSFARVTKRLRDANGLPIGTANNNPILDTRMYEVEYPDRHKASLSANAIAQNICASGRRR